MSKYDEDLKKACEILNNTELDELVQVAVEAMDDAAIDIGMEANQEWHAKITLESALMHIAEKVAKRPQLTIPKSIADELEEEIEEAYSNDYIRSYSDVGAYMEVITDGLDEDSELYKFMFPDNDALLGCSHRNIIYLYLVDNDLVKVVEG